MDKQTLARTIAMGVIAILDLLKVKGVDFGLTDAEIENIILAVLSVAIGLRVWWKDNNVTKKRKLKEFAFKEMENILESEKEVENDE